jgi:hypothetical protein
LPAPTHRSWSTCTFIPLTRSPAARARRR